MEETDIAALHQEHKRLEDTIQEESARLVPDELLLADLKRQKLRIKDQIAANRRAA